MLKKIYQNLLPFARWKNVLIGLVLMVFANVVAFPFFLEKIKTVAPEAMGPLDLRFSYSPEEAYQAIKSYGERGREIAVQATVGVDILYPVIYTLTLILLLIILFKKVFPNHPHVYLWALLPFATFFSDMFENIGIIMMIKIFPEKMDNVALLTSVCSSVKWSFVGIVSLFIVFLSIKILFQKK